MVDLKLETVNFSNKANDTYIAVRVGESQKLTRLANARNFKFPQSAVGDRRFGKVDVFKRVGSASLSIRSDPAAPVQELTVNCNEGTTINFKATLGGATQAQADKPEAKEKDMTVAVSEAKLYLEQHNLEMLLSDVMQAVLRERPPNPTQFMAERIKQTEGTYRKGPSPDPAPAGNEGDKPPGIAVTAPAEASPPKATPANPDLLEPPIKVEDLNMKRGSAIGNAAADLFKGFPEAAHLPEKDHTA